MQLRRVIAAIMAGLIMNAGVARAPQRTTQVLARVYLGLDAVAQLDRMANVDKMSTRDAARAWMKPNRSVVDAWFES